jgi:Nif-specific regulatory protein
MKYHPSRIIGTSKKIQSVYHLIEKVSATPATVLILGESGVGKELVAQAIHYASGRSDQTFVAFNCAALSESLIESELFGHERGSFTGASGQKKGRFEAAAGGTIFLDEVSEVSLSVQAKLLRVLQERSLERVGGTETIYVDVRIIAATNRNLEELISEGRFRSDLYYRLNVFPIIIPPLRERKSDIPLLVDFFLDKYSSSSNKKIARVSTAALDMMMGYSWPGNVRELENVIERAVILSDDGSVHSYHLPPSIQSVRPQAAGRIDSLDRRLNSIENKIIVEALKNASGNISKAAQELGITERVLSLRLKKFSINYRDFRN